MTSRAEILAAARQLIDRDGWEKLSVRRLAAEIGIGATTLYHHVRDKEDLLVLMLNEYLGQIERPELPDEPRDRIVAAAVAARDALRAWPWAAEVLTVDGFIGRLSEPALWMVEVILAGIKDCGCSDEQAVHIFRSIWFYTVGEILVRARSRRRPADDEPPISFRAPDPAQLPHLAALFGQWKDLAARDTYAEGIGAFVDGMLARADSTRAESPASSATR